MGLVAIYTTSFAAILATIFANAFPQNRIYIQLGSLLLAQILNISDTYSVYLPCGGIL
jgi:hypothetical protein